MGKAKYFFFDIDGTLVPDAGGQKVPESTQRAIDELRGRGNFCAIATGRPQYMIVKLCRTLGFDDFVSDGGNGITIDGELKSLDPMPHEACVTLAEQCDEKGFPWAAATDNCPTRYTKDQRFSDYISGNYARDIIMPDFDIRTCLTIYKMYIVCKEGEESKLSALSDMNWIRYTPDHIIVEPGNKEVGIRKMLDYFHAPYSQAVVFGDSTNDLTMFQPEWTSIAMGNAIPELKAKADFVTKESKDDGIAYALRYFGWIA